MEFEDQRVEFLTGIAALLANKARLKLNTKKLYASDGKAVQELLKLATLLYKYVFIYILFCFLVLILYLSYISYSKCIQNRFQKGYIG